MQRSGWKEYLFEVAPQAVVGAHGRCIGSGIEEGDPVTLRKRRHENVGVPKVERLVDVAGDRRRLQRSAAGATGDWLAGKIVEGRLGRDVEAAVDPHETGAALRFDSVYREHEQSGVLGDVIAGLDPYAQSSVREGLAQRRRPRRQIETAPGGAVLHTQPAADVEGGEMRKRGAKRERPLERFAPQRDLVCEDAAPGVEVQRLDTQTKLFCDGQRLAPLLGIEAELCRLRARIGELVVATDGDPGIDPQADPPTGRPRAEPPESAQRRLARLRLRPTKRR